MNKKQLLGVAKKVGIQLDTLKGQHLKEMLEYTKYLVSENLNLSEIEILLYEKVDMLNTQNYTEGVGYAGMDY